MSEGPSFSDIDFREYLKFEKIMASKCKDCGKIHLPPKPICTKCFGKNLEWVELPKRGKLVAFTCIAIGPPEMKKEGFDRNNPYCTGVIEILDGVRIDSRIQGVDPKMPENIKIGMPMKADFIHKEKNGIKYTIIGFRPE